MAGLFDDLIPQQGAAPAAQPAVGANPFADLIPPAQAPVPLPTPRPPQAASPSLLKWIGDQMYDAAKAGAHNVTEAFDPYSATNTARFEREKNAPLYDISGEVGQLGTVAKGVQSAVGLPFQAAIAPVRSAVGNAYDAVAPSFTPQQTQKLAASGISLPSGAEAFDTALAGLRPSDATPVGTTKPMVQAPLTKAQVPSVDALEASATAKYEDPVVKSVQFTPQAVQNLSGSIKQGLLDNRVDVYNAPKVSGIIDRLNEPRFAGNHTIDDLEMARQSLNNVPPDEYRAAQIAKGQIDNYLGGNIAQGDLISGDANAANSLLSQARGDYAAAQRAREIDRALHNADIQAGSTYSGGNLNNATRQQLRPLLKVKKGQRQFTPPGWTQEETDQLARAVVGTNVGNYARMIGKLGPDGKLGFLSHLIAAKETGGMSIPLSVAAIIAKRVGEASTNRQSDLLSQILRSRSPLAQSVQAGNVVQAMPTSPQALAAAIAARQAALGFGSALPAYADQEQPH